MTASEAELRQLYVRYAPILHHRARSILGSDEAAADAVQETFSRVLRHWEQFRAEASPLTWMYQISTNWCLNQLRNRKGRQQKHTDFRAEIAGRESTVADEASGRDYARLRELLSDADDETRRIVIHLYFDDMTREETAVMVGISVPTLRKRHDAFVKRARKVLGVSVLAGVAAWLVSTGWLP